MRPDQKRAPSDNKGTLRHILVKSIQAGAQITRRPSQTSSFRHTPSEQITSGNACRFQDTDPNIVAALRLAAHATVDDGAARRNGKPGPLLQFRLELEGPPAAVAGEDLEVARACRSAKNHLSG
mmetsp:Transcript_30700/g.73087  ORF Transcript_30700/g.73087 Transcript_30700/m.73087 type:complete len:124 (+) Transcript_30700:139-510(+)